MLGRFYEEPIIYLVALMFSVFLYLNQYYRTAGATLSFLIGGAFMAYQISKGRYGVNSTKRNTTKALISGFVGVGLTIGASLLIGFFLSGLNLASVGSFISSSKSTVIGAQISPLQQSPWLELLIFTVMFPIVETLVAMRIFLLLVQAWDAKLDFKDWRVHLSAALVGIGAIFYHIYAKQVSSGGINTNVLIVMFLIFYAECMLVVYAKEIEPAIWHHIFNNVLALGPIYALQTMIAYPLLPAAIVAFVFVAYKKNLRKVLA